MRKILIIILLASLTGCTALKDKAEDYVKTAVVNELERKLEDKLEKQGLTITSITSALDLNGDGKITKDEIITVVKESASEIALAEGKKLVDSKLKDSNSFWKWLLGALISGYLSKQLVAIKMRAKKDKVFHDRIVVLEKLAGIDLGVDTGTGTDTETSSGGA